MIPGVHRGPFIVFEGGEGAGKSSLIKRLQIELTKKGQNVLVTREPGGTPLGEKLRTLLKDPAAVGAEFCSEAEFLIFAASRVQHVKEIIRPALEKKKWVLCDRFCDSSWVYQGYVKKAPFELIDEVHRSILGTLLPDLTFFMDVDPLVGLERTKNREYENAAGDRFEGNGIEFHEKVREGYMLLLKKNPERYVRIDTSQPVEYNLKIALKALEERYL